MNCANHPDVPRAAFCRTCGKALCANCTRTVRGVIYCENCLAARLEGTLPPPSARRFRRLRERSPSFRLPVRIPLWPAFWPASFPLA